jgi:hypothetical protein
LAANASGFGIMANECIYAYGVAKDVINEIYELSKQLTSISMGKSPILNCIYLYPGFDPMGHGSLVFHGETNPIFDLHSYGFLNPIITILSSTFPLKLKILDLGNHDHCP